MFRSSSTVLRAGVVALTLSVAMAGAPRRAAAHGLHGHIHVTGWAIENLPEGELKDIFADEDVFYAALAGAMFPDTGYALDRPAARDYAEHSHWEPFIEDFIEYMLATYGPDYDSKHEKMMVAFLLGCASHGLQDEIFDSLFVYETEERDGRGQDLTDPGTDGFLVQDGWFRLLPEDFFPVDELLPLYASVNSQIDASLIQEHIRTVRNAYVNDLLGTRVAAGFGARYRPQIPWAAAHYLDMDVPGSLASEIEPTMYHMQALWDRLHGRFDESGLVVHAFPDAPRRLRSHRHEQVASWVTMIFGKGVEQDSATASLLDASGLPHPFNLRYTRWGGTSRLIRFLPTADFVPGANYTAILEPGAELVDGTVTTMSHSHDFTVDCDPNDPLAGAPAEGACEEIVVTDDPVIAGPEPTATPTATATATETELTEATHTATPEPTHTATLVPTSTVAPEPTPTVPPTATATRTIGLVPITPSHTATPTQTSTALPTSTPEPTRTFTPTPFPGDDDDDGCHVTPSGGSRSGLGVLLLAGAIFAMRRRSRSPICRY